jgi:hypothetical protein
MQKELREMSKETTQEASSVYAKQLNYDRQIADLNVTISKLQSSLREAERNPSSEFMRTSSTNSDDGDMANQVKSLSEEVLRLREKIASFNSESLAMKNRLKSAMDRAAKAEDHLVEARTPAASNDDFESMERGPTGNGMSRRRRGGGNQSVGSIRSTLRLQPGQGEGREQIGKVVDVVDGFAVTTGRSCRNGSSIMQLCARVSSLFYHSLSQGNTYGAIQLLELDSFFICCLSICGLLYYFSCTRMPSKQFTVILGPVSVFPTALMLSCNNNLSKIFCNRSSKPRRRWKFHRNSIKKITLAFTF